MQINLVFEKMEIAEEFLVGSEEYYDGRPPKILGSTQQEDLGGDRKSVFVCDFAVHIALTPIQPGIAKGSLTLPTTSYS